MKKLTLKPLLCAVGFCLGMNHSAFAATATVDFSGFTESGSSPNFSVAGTVTHPASGVSITLATSSSSTQVARLGNPTSGTPTSSALFVPSYPSGTLTSTVTLNFSVVI